MPSLNDFFTQIQQVNANLQQLNADLQTIHADEQQVHADLGVVDSTLKKGFSDLVSLQTYADLALDHLAKQNDTIICILEKISQNACTLVNQGDLEVRYEESIRDSAASLKDMYETVHPDAALVLERASAARRELLECCPSPEPKPVCSYEPCRTPGPLPEPPKPDQQPVVG